MKRSHHVIHISLGVYLILAGIFLIAVASVLAVVGIDRFYAVFSPQGRINPRHLQGTYDATESIGYFNNQAVSVPVFLSDENEQERKRDENILGITNTAQRIEIDLSTQMLQAYEGENLIFSFPVSTGKWNKTPTGIFRVWVKLRYTLMQGGSKPLGTYYYLPNVPYTLFFANDEHPRSEGYGIHGAYWHSNFGQPMSHGCINLSPDDAAKLYYWADPKLGRLRSVRAAEDNPGVEVIIFGTAPDG